MLIDIAYCLRHLSDTTAICGREFFHVQSRCPATCMNAMLHWKISTAIMCHAGERATLPQFSKQKPPKSQSCKSARPLPVPLRLVFQKTSSAGDLHYGSVGTLHLFPTCMATCMQSAHFLQMTLDLISRKPSTSFAAGQESCTCTCAVAAALECHSATLFPFFLRSVRQSVFTGCYHVRLMSRPA
jgi:hypothetical protein